MLYIVATPIGNLEDISLRALRVLKEADVIIAEDTRHTGLLLKHYQIPHKPMISFYDEIEAQKVDEVIRIAQVGKAALVSDAGTPLISDPGYKLVRRAIKEGIKVEIIPGPSALVTALIVSGLPPDKFAFWGYPPEKESHQRNLLTKLTPEMTNIFFVSPYKLLKFLGILSAVFGDREIVIARELTKIHEEVWQGKISQALEKYKLPRGEFVVLFH